MRVWSRLQWHNLHKIPWKSVGPFSSYMHCLCHHQGDYVIRSDTKTLGLQRIVGNLVVLEIILAHQKFSIRCVHFMMVRNRNKFLSSLQWYNIYANFHENPLSRCFMNVDIWIKRTYYALHTNAASMPKRREHTKWYWRFLTLKWMSELTGCPTSLGTQENSVICKKYG